MVEQVHIIGTGPCAARPDLLEGRNPVGEQRPELIFEQMRIHAEIITVHLGVGLALGWRDASDEQLARGIGPPFGPAPRPARVDQQGHTLQSLFAMEGIDKAFLGDDRNVDPRKGCHLASIGTRRIDQRAARDHLSRFQHNGHNLAPLPHHIDHFVSHIGDAERARLAAEGLHQGPAVEPALAGTSPRAAGQIIDMQPRKLRGQSGPVEQRDIRAFAGLDGVIVVQGHGTGIGGTGTAGQIEIAALVQVDHRHLAIHRQVFAQMTQEIDPVERNPDIDGGGELLADRGGRQGRGGFGIGRVFFNHHNTAGKRRIACQMKGNGRADCGTADDHHIG